jgi:hypothetical protein
VKTSGGLVQMPAGTDAWALHDLGCWLVVPTNTCRRRNGQAVMGAGLAGDAARRYPDLPGRYGNALRNGNTRIIVHDHRLLLAPTKNDWRHPARMPLVHELLTAAAAWCAVNPYETLVVPAPGCGLGGLAWEPVRAAAMQRLRAHRVLLLAPR